jgi:hypothetical protein
VSTALLATAQGTVWLWDAGQTSGAAGHLDGAKAAAEPYLADGAEGRAEEAEMIRTPVGGAGITHVHRRTGRAWRGTLEDGKPVWERVSGRSG